ncbi:hypothetical protein BD410DRAFT_630725 [Rickenella mellea]|uniref:DUF6533 domain-containing protein n=1 Tax=Rickenella mellea TaxID=50990 RepID=A0A4Y7QC97_9AGAM|nr:hypothetical protein BD410DRAFT_630725 [Rickenella mellea]
MSVLPPSVIVSFFHIYVVHCTTIAAVTVLIWDYLITLPDEVALVWPSSWSISKFLFMLNRYLVFIDSIMLVYVLMFGDDAKVCTNTFRILAFISVVGCMAGQCILILRAYAVWGSQFNKLYAVIFGTYLCIFAVTLWAAAKYIGGAYSTGIPALGMKGCTLFFKNRLAWVDIALIAVIEIVSTGLMIIKAIQHFRVSRSSLMTIIYHDGLLYFAFLLAATISNLMVIVFAPVEISEFMVVVQRVLHSVLCSRIILHIRSAYKAQTRYLSGDTLPPMVIAKAVEPLNHRLWPRNQYGGKDYSTFNEESEPSVN